jgi:dephospho-CoA kinase
VCRFLAALGRTVLFADQIANNLTSSDPQIRSQLSREFGPSIFLSDGSLDRQKLSEIVFQNKSFLKKLDSIIHPRVVRHIRNTIDNLPPARQRPFVVVEAALIYEAHLEAMFDYIVVVDAPLDIRVSRAMTQRSLSETEVLRRVQAQIPAEKLARKGDFVIHNHKTEAELQQQVFFLDGLFSTLGR